MNVLDGIFYKRKMFQSKYHQVEIQYLGAITKPTWATFFAYVIMFFPTYAGICLGNCPVSARVRKAVYLFNMYSNIFVNIQNIQLLIFFKQNA